MQGFEYLASVGIAFGLTTPGVAVPPARYGTALLDGDMQVLLLVADNNSTAAAVVDVHVVLVEWKMMIHAHRIGH